MKHFCFTLFFLSCFSATVFSQIALPNLFSKLYDNGSEDRISDFFEDTDYGFVCAGYTTSLGAGGEDVWLFKTDSSGNLLWQKTFGGAGNDFCDAVIKCSDGGFLLAGTFETNMHPSPYIIKTDSLGNLQWQYNTQRGFWAILSGIIELDNGDIIATGRSGDWNTVPFGDYLIKVNSNGNYIWEKGFNFSTADGASRAVKSPEGNIVVNSFTLGAAADINIFKCDTSGSTIWNSYLSPTIYADAAYDIISTSADSTYLITGNINYSSPPHYSKGYLVKINNNGDTLWTETITGVGDYFLRSSAYDDNGNIISFGNTYGICTPISSSLLLIKSTGLGVATDVEYYCDSFFNWTANRIIKTHDNKFVIAGIKFIGSSTNSIDGFLIKLNEDSVFTSTNEIGAQHNEFSIFPNPFTNKISFHSSISSIEKISISVFNSIGEKLFERETLLTDQEINLSPLQSGIYFLKIKSNKIFITKKIVKL